MMTRNWALAAALLSLAVSIGCSSAHTQGGGGGVQVSISETEHLAVLYVTQVVHFTATVTGTNNTAVTWGLSQNGTDCTTNPACGTLSATTGGTVTYTAPSTAPNPSTVDITATSQADTSKSHSVPITITQITVTVSPSPVNGANVGVGLQQQFVAVAVPDDAPQTFTWPAPTCTSGSCGTVVQDPNNPALAVYTAPGTANSAKVSAVSTVDPSGPFGQVNVNVLNSRLPSGTYAFRFSGFNLTGAISVVGNFVSNGNGTIQGGMEDDLSSSGAVHCTINNSSTYTLSSNSLGTITLNASCNGTATSNRYSVVLDAGGDIRIIETTPGDTTGRHGSGLIEPVPSPGRWTTAFLQGSFAFGLTGTDLNGKRVGFVGVVTLDGAGGVTSATMDINDNGTANGPITVSACTTCYTMSNGVGTLNVTANGQTYQFALYGVSGQKGANNPLTLYATSVGPFDANHPAISGTIVFQDPNQTYDNTTLKGITVINLTGADSTGGNANVALALAATDGSGNISGIFDQNNAGTLTPTTVSSSSPAQAFGTGYKYSIGCTGCGRYTVNLLGNPNANPPQPMPLVMYASGANRGFLLDQSSTSVMTGTMDLQLPRGHAYSASELPSPYVAGTQSAGDTSVTPIVGTLLLTCGGGVCSGPTYNVSGTQHAVSGDQTLTGTYTDTSDGVGVISLTAPSNQTYVFYQIDLTHFWLMDMDASNTQSSIIYVQQ